jgi:hypothetical protein
MNYEVPSLFHLSTVRANYLWLISNKNYILPRKHNNRHVKKTEFQNLNTNTEDVIYNTNHTSHKREGGGP